MIIYETSHATAPIDGEMSIVSNMAATMQDMDAVGEAVTPENLKLRNFSSEEIMRFGLRAASLARKLSVKQTN